MSFLYPAFLIGAIAIALPIVLHLLRRDVAPEVPFTAVRLLKRSHVERDDRHWLRDLLLLIARVVALLLLAAAFARPYLQGAAPAGVLVVAVDRSYSMGGPSRFTQALERARKWIDGARSGEQVAVITFDDRADVLAVPGGKADARAALEGLAAGYGATRYNPVIHKAIEAAAGANGRLVLVTDLQRSGWEGEPPASLPATWQLEVDDVGASDQNVGVTAVGVDADRVVATIHNSGSSPRSGRVHVAVDGREMTAANYSVNGGSSVQVPLTWRAPSSGALAVSVDDPGGLPADDTRYVVLGARGASRALVVADATSGLYVSRAIESSTGEESSFDAEHVTGAAFAAMPADRVSSYQVVALLTTNGIDRTARETLGRQVQNGTGLFVAAGAGIDPSVLAGLANWQPPISAVEQADTPLTLAATDLRHPIFRPFGALAANLGQVRFNRAWRVRSDGWSVIGRFSNGTPALLERALGQGRVVLLASDVDRRWNDFPLHPSFVPFALETIRYLAGDRRQPREYTIAQAPAGAGPGPGVFRAGDNRLVAINVDPKESALDRIPVDAFTQLVPRSTAVADRAADVAARQTEARQSYWQYGLMVMIAALVAESLIGRA
jgi:hypothetical protein